MPNKYTNYDELRQNERENVDYAIFHRGADSQIAVMAPHGGGIEPGTIDIADAMAGNYILIPEAEKCVCPGEGILLREDNHGF